MSDSDGPPGVSATEHRRILRWIAAVALLTTAEDQLGVDVPELNAVGLLAAEAACEAMLGLVVGSLQAKVVGGREPGFLEVLGEAITAANGGISRELRNDLQGMHRTRNAFVHGGSAVDLAELERAVQAAHRLTGVVPVAGRRPVTGVASSLADVIEFEIVGLWLRHSDTMAAGGSARPAADALARALDAALTHTDPPIRTTTGLSTRQRVAAMRREGERADLGGMIDETVRSIDQLTRWVYPLAIGTPPAELAWLESVIGRPTHEDTSGYPNRVMRGTGDPTTGELRRASALVCRIVLRLWATGALTMHRSDDEVARLAREWIGKREPSA